MNEDTQPKTITFSPLMWRGSFYMALLLGAFLFGFVPIWLKSRQCSRSLSEAEQHDQPGQDEPDGQQEHSHTCDKVCE